ncbi:MAG TPA: PQQ-dependent sugar dehydrogenase [Fimbriimonadaceae bacterium]|nr:PQQ-dependent sugar dehydrogenase [Fimbriimonadaceae bacterium]
MKGRTLALLGILLATPSVHAQSITAVSYASGFTLPILMVQDPTNPSVQFVVQQRGRIRTLVNGVVQATDFISLSGTVSSTGSERGLLGMCFDPNYANNRYFYVSYPAASGGASTIRRYQRNAINPLLADTASAHPIMTVSQPFQNHNGGTIRFGQDGYLYFGLGDGGDSYDPGNRAQNKNELLGKLLRIDISGDDFPADSSKNYRVPPSNPFVGVDGADEVWSWGLRNPWKWSFDDPTKLGNGGLYIADVGQDLWEEINYIPPSAAGGRNFGWRAREGFVSTGLSGGAPPYTDPFHVYSHSDGISITGGYVYRGTMLGDNFGKYFFADFGFRRVWAAAMAFNGSGEAITPSSVVEHTDDLNLPTNGTISSIDVDSNGELYLVTWDAGRVYKLVPLNAAWITDITPLLYTPINGGLRHTLSADGQTLRMNPQTIYDLLDENQSQAVFGFTTDMTAAPLMDITLRAACNSPTFGRVQVLLKNWSTGKFVPITTFVLGTSLANFSVANVSAAPYRRASDQRIEVMLRSYHNAPAALDPFEVRVDLLKVRPHN